MALWCDSKCLVKAKGRLYQRQEDDFKGITHDRTQTKGVVGEVKVSRHLDTAYMKTKEFLFTGIENCIWKAQLEMLSGCFLQSHRRLFCAAIHFAGSVVSEPNRQMFMEQRLHAQPWEDSISVPRALYSCHLEWASEAACTSKHPAIRKSSHLCRRYEREEKITVFSITW